MKSEKTPTSSRSTGREVPVSKAKMATKKALEQADKPVEKKDSKASKTAKKTVKPAPKKPVTSQPKPQSSYSQPSYNSYDSYNTYQEPQPMPEPPKPKVELNKYQKKSITCCVILLIFFGALIIDGILTLYDPKFFYGPLRYITPIAYGKGYKPQGDELALISKLPAYYTLTLIPIFVELIVHIIYVKNGKYNWLISHLSCPVILTIVIGLLFIVYTMPYHNNYSSIVHNFFEPGYDAFLDDVRYAITNFLTGFAGHGYWFIAPFFVNIALEWKFDRHNCDGDLDSNPVWSIIWTILLMVVTPLVIGRVVSAKNTWAVVAQFLILVIMGFGSFMSTGGGRYRTYHGTVHDDGSVTWR